MKTFEKFNSSKNKFDKNRSDKGEGVVAGYGRRGEWVAAGYERERRRGGGGGSRV